MPPVHPRGRGEHRHRRRACGREVRFIPAGAGNTTITCVQRWVRPVHPRGRGEHDRPTRIHTLSLGSSPRARGTREHEQSRDDRDRFIPAGAGNTPERQGTPARKGVHPRGRGEHKTEFPPRPANSTVHPRGRGEHSRHAAVNFYQHGSSPRARGTRPGRRPQNHRHRFIPAGAGNTKLICRPAPLMTVHPRGRGEHQTTYTVLGQISGSSPRARGTPRRRRKPHDQGRFIPAGAGNTQYRTRHAREAPVHPRGRGEHVGARGFAAEEGGSSPRARGTRPVEPAAGGIDRFIPAGAGNTPSRASRRGDRSVHPRGRGEHVYRITNNVLMAGSSPRARGTRQRRHSPSAERTVHPRGRGEHFDVVQRGYKVTGSSPRARGTRAGNQSGCDLRRFIPAGAGNTLEHSERRCIIEVHPRGRGEHVAGLSRRRTPTGSSPRARGTLIPSTLSQVFPGFIPAGAGNTWHPTPRPHRDTVHPRGRGEHSLDAAVRAVEAGSSPRARGTRRTPLLGRSRRRFIPAGAGNTVLMRSS